MQGAEARLRRKKKKKKWPQSKARNGLCIIFTSLLWEWMFLPLCWSSRDPTASRRNHHSIPFFCQGQPHLQKLSLAIRVVLGFICKQDVSQDSRAALSASGTWQCTHDRTNPAQLTAQHTKNRPKTKKNFLKASPALTSPPKKANYC